MKAKPINCTRYVILGEISCRKTASISDRSIKPPSSTGIGSKFIIKREIDIIATNDKRLAHPSAMLLLKPS